MASAKVIHIPMPMGAKPRTFTSQEALIEAVRLEIYHSGKLYKDIAKACEISSSTVHNLASGKTRWPRASTLFPLIHHLGFDLALTKRRR